MRQIKFYFNDTRLKGFDRRVALVLFVCLSILPLFDNFVWISTRIILPGLLILLFFKNTSFKIEIDAFLKRFIILFLFAVISIINIYSLDEYLFETQKFLGVIVAFLLISFYLRRNVNNIWLLYLILFTKFIIMVYFTYKQGIITNFDAEAGRLKSGAEVGINANAYGYFAFISLFCLAVISNIKKHWYLKLAFIFVIAISLYMNMLAASRAGTIFTILSSLLIYISLSFTSWKKLIFQTVLLLSGLSILLSFVFDHYSNIVLFERFNTFSSSGEDERVTIIKNGIELISENFFGVGAGHFTIYMKDFSNLKKVAASHNAFLLIAANYGLAALFVYLSVFIYFFKNSISLIKSKQLIIRKYGFLFLSFGITFFFYNFFYDMILNLYIMFMFFLINYHQKIIIRGVVPTPKV